MDEINDKNVWHLLVYSFDYDDFDPCGADKLEFIDKLFTSKRKAAAEASRYLKETFKLQVSVRDMLKLPGLAYGAKVADNRYVSIRERIVH